MTLRLPFSDFREDSDAQEASGLAAARFGSFVGIAALGGGELSAGQSRFVQNATHSATQALAIQKGPASLRLKYLKYREDVGGPQRTPTFDPLIKSQRLGL